MQDIQFYESKHQDGDVIREHHHARHQFLYALSGKGKTTLDGKIHDFERNSGMMIVPYSNHSIMSDSRLTVLVLAFDEGALDADIRGQLLQVEFPKSRMIRLNPIGDNELRRLLRKMLFEQSHADPFRRVALQIYFQELLLVIVRNKLTCEVSNANSLRAEKLKHYIDTHYYEIGNAESMASKLGVSVRHIHNIFKEAWGMTPLQYLTEVRMGLAKNMLAETDKDIASICFEIGFESLSTFYRTFRQVTSLSPLQYRRLYADAGRRIPVGRE